MPFRDCVGHRRLLGVLARSVHRGRLPPSLLLAGPEGVGKKRVAVALAQALNCTAPVVPPSTGSAGALEVDACGACPACRRIARGIHPDVLLVEPQESGAIKVDQIRDVVDRAGYRPFEGKRRVVIIDDAETLVPQGQNALLKTLEEPGAGSVFLLVTSKPDALLPTVRSRCPLLRFRHLGAADVAAVLMTRGVSESEARAIAASADGSVGRALLASAGELVEFRDVATRALLRLASAQDARGRLEVAKDLVSKGASGAAERDQLALHLRAAASLLRDAALLGAGADAQWLANPDVRPDLERLAAFAGERGVRAFGAVDQALAALERNGSAKIVADWVVLQI